MRFFKKLTVLIICAVSVFLFAGCNTVSVGTGTNYQNLSLMIENSYPKVVSIEAFAGLNSPRSSRLSAGSGVIIHSTPTFSLVVTNAHVVANENGVYYNYFSIINWSKELYKGEVDTLSSSAMAPYTSSPRVSSSQILYWNIAEDIAIIKYTPPAAFRNQAVSLRDTRLRVGEPVAALGYSLGEFYRSSVGVVTQVFPEIVCYDENMTRKEFDYGFMHDATTLQGNSGGPVFDADGNVIGLTTMVALMGTTEGDIKAPAVGFSIALSSRAILEVLNRPAHSSWFA